MIRVGRHHPSFLAILAAVLALAGWAVKAQASVPNTWTTVAPLPEGLLWPKVASAAGKLYVFGGGGAHSFGTTFEAYDPQTNRWFPLGSMPESLGGLSTATTGPDGLIYIDDGPAMLVYDPQANTWSHAPPPPGVQDSALLVTGADGRIYAVGGRVKGAAVGTLSAYNPSTRAWTSLTPNPTPRYDSAATVGPDGRIYVIGGVQTLVTSLLGSDKVEAYDPKTNTWVSVASLPTPRTGLQAVTGPDGRIYALGGQGRCFSAPCNEVEAYDVHTRMWTSVAPMPHGRGGFVAAVGPDGRIYVLGGDTTMYAVRPAFLPTEVDAYTVIPGDQPLPRPLPGPTVAARGLAPMPTGRDDLGAATSGGKIYAIGGETVIPPQSSPPTARVLRTVEAYDPQTNTWASEPKLPAPRADMGVATGPDGRIYVLGGGAASPDQFPSDGDIAGLNTVFIYNPRTHRWSRGKPMPDGRYGLVAVTGKDGRIYTIGGGTVCHADEPCDGNQTVRAFNPRANTWTTLAPLHMGRFLPAAAVGNDGRIYVFGGEESIPRPSFEVYDPRKNRWTEVAGLPHVRTFGFAAAAVGDGRIDLIGGCLFIDARPTGLNDYYAYCGDPSPVDAYDPRTNRWTSIGVTLNARQGLAATTGPDGHFYAVGGAGYGDGKLLEVIKSGSMAAAQAPGKSGRSRP